jgi:hypothetical protein
MTSTGLVFIYGSSGVPGTALQEFLNAAQLDLAQVAFACAQASSQVPEMPTASVALLVAAEDVQLTSTIVGDICKRLVSGATLYVHCARPGHEVGATHVWQLIL